MRSHQRADLERVGQISLFAGCTPRELAAISRLCTEVEVPAGEVLCRESEPGHQCFVIVEGEVSVAIGGREVALLGPGSFFGETAALDRGLRMATVSSCSPLSVLAFTPSEFQAVFEVAPRVARRVLVAVESRLRMVSRTLYAQAPV
jgi:CRP-like cAMP-binding protein